jgi:hypothetical protein
MPELRKLVEAYKSYWRISNLSQPICVLNPIVLLARKINADPSS